jgi:hypothetical protein
MLNNSTKIKETKEKKENKETKEKKENKKKPKQLKVVSIDLIEQHKQEKEEVKEEKQEQQEKQEQLNSLSLEQENLQWQINIDLRYFANQNQNSAFKTNKLEDLLSTNYLLKDIYTNIEENIDIYKEQILKYNATTLEKLVENSNKIMNGEKYKLYYLLYVLNLISHLKEKKIKNSIKEELKDFTNISSFREDTSLNDFNIHNTTLNSMCTKKCITNLDLFVVRKTTNNKQKILPQKRS